MSCTCGDLAALLSAQIREPDSSAPACPVHRPARAEPDRAPLALNDDTALAAVIGLALSSDPHFEGGTVPPTA